MRRLALLALVVAAGVVAATAAAGRTEKASFTVQASGTLDSMCSFPVLWEGTISGFDVYLYNDDGTLGADQMHGTEVDVLSANGRSLTSDPYPFNMRLTYDPNGDFASFYAAGVVAKFRLPDGTTWVSAGRTNIVPRLGQPWLWYPDSGAFGDVTELCAALAP